MSKIWDWWKRPPNERSASEIRVQSLEPRVLYSAAPLEGAEAPDADVDVDLDGEWVDDLQADSLSDSWGDGLGSFADWSDGALDFSPLDSVDDGESAPERPLEVVFVDPTVEGFQQLMDALAAENLDRRLEFVMLDQQASGIEQISQSLAAFGDISAAHLIAHGADGRLVLGNELLSMETLDRYGEEISRWGESLRGADLLLYGCNLAETANGARFVDALQTLTGADVAASNDLTGAVSLAGDWELEYMAGDVETATLSAAQWEGILPPPYQVTGFVFDDLSGDGDIAGDMGMGGVSLSFYLDMGDGQLSNDDLFVGTTVTGMAGDYIFTGLAEGTYWVTVDSNTLSTNGGATTTIVAEQTYGSAGSVSFDGATYSYSTTAGAHYGGLTAGVSDSQLSLTTMQHVIRVELLADATDVNFGFSLNAITNTNDDIGQGTLRTFLANAKQVGGIHTSQFALSTSDPNYGVTTANTWTITLGSDLPAITNTVNLDATTQAGYAGVPLVEIDGEGQVGLVIGHAATGSTIRGLSIYDMVSDVSIKADNVTFAENHLGADATGTVNLGGGGLQLQGNSGVIQDNLIVGSAGDGVIVQGESTVLLRNRIGVGLDGSSMGNAGVGVRLQAIGNKIGDGDPLDGNEIAFNGGAGIVIEAGQHWFNYIRVNSIHDNGGLGIDHLDDDAIQSSSLTDGIANIPLVTYAGSHQGNLRVTGLAPLDTTVDIFASDAADPSGFGEGAVYVGTVTLSPFNIAFDVTFANPLPTATVITAVATDANSTSELSNAFEILEMAPVIDLDDDDSTASGANSAKTFVEGGASVAIADVDVSLKDEFDQIASMTVSISNLQDAGLEFLDVDVSGTSLSKVYDPATGVLQITGDETATVYETLLSTVTYEHRGDAPTVADREITVVAQDQMGLDGNTAVATVSIAAVNDAPTIAAPNTAAAIATAPLVFSSATGNGVTLNDVDLGAGEIKVTLTATSGALSLGSVTGLTFLQGDGLDDGVIEFTGSLADANAALDGLQFVADTGFTGAASVDVEVDDQGGSGGPAEQAAHSIAVDVQTSFAVQDTSGNEDTPIPILITPTGTGGGGYRVAGAPTGVTLSAGTNLGSGVWDLTTAELSGLELNPAANFFGDLALTVTHGGVTKSLTVTVNSVNDLPTTSGIPDQTVDEDGAASTVDLPGFFADVEDLSTDLTYSIIGNTNATLLTPSIDATNRLHVSLVADAHGTGTLTVRAMDLDGGFVDASFVVTVNSVNDLPTGTIPDMTVDEDAPTTVINLWNHYSDVEDPEMALQFSVVSNTNSSLVAATPNNLTGSLDLSYAADQSGVADITIQVQDQDGGVHLDTFTVSVSPVADAPTSNGISDINTVEDASSDTVDLNAVFDDVDSPDTTLIYSVVANSGPSLIDAAIDAGGVLTLNYLPDQFGASTISVRATDPEGNATDETFTINVAPVNDAPTGALANVTVNEDAAPLAVDLHAAFDDVDDPDTALIFTVTGNTNSALVSASLNQTTGQLTLSFSPNQNGGATITVEAMDPAGATVSRSFDVTVTPVTDGPTSTGPVTVTANEDDANRLVDLNTVFDDVDTPDSSLAYTVVSNSQPSLVDATIGAGGNVVLSFQTNQSGSSAVTVRATDLEGNFVDEVVTVNVAPVNDAPTGALANVTVNEDAAPLAVDLHAAFDDVDDPDTALIFTVTGNTDSALVSTSLNQTTGQLTLSFSPNQNGGATITVEAMDPAGATVSRSFDVTVTPVTDGPTSTGPVTVTMAEDSPGRQVNLKGIFDDVDTPVRLLNFTVVSNSDPHLVDATIAPGGNGGNGGLTLLPQPDQFGAGTVTVRATDPDGNSATEVVAVNVMPVNDAPAAVGEVVDVPSRSSANVSFAEVLANDSDVDGDVLSVVVTGGPANGVLEVVRDGLVYTPNIAFSGTDVVTYVVSDGTVSSNAVELKFVASPTGAAPSSQAQTQTTEPEPTTETTAEESESENEETVPMVSAPTTEDDSEDAAQGAAVRREVGEERDRKVFEFQVTQRSAAREDLVESVNTIVGAQDTTVDTSATSNGDGNVEVVSTFSTHSTAVMDLMAYYAEHAEMWKELDDVGTQMQEPLTVETMVIGSSAIAGSLLSVTYVMWLARGGYMLSTLMAQLPAWRLIDPLPVLDRMTAYSEDDASLEEMLDDSNNDLSDSPQAGLESPDEATDGSINEKHNVQEKTAGRDERPVASSQGRVN